MHWSSVWARRANYDRVPKEVVLSPVQSARDIPGPYPEKGYPTPLFILARPKNLADYFNPSIINHF